MVNKLQEKKKRKKLKINIWQALRDSTNIKTLRIDINIIQCNINDCIRNYILYLQNEHFFLDNY